MNYMATGIPNVVILDPLLTSHVIRSMRSELLAFNLSKCNFEALYLRNCQVRRMVTMTTNGKPHMPSPMVT